MTNERGIEPLVLVGDNLETALSKDLASVREVRHVLIDRVNDAMLVWIAVDNPTRAVRDKVYQKELELMDAFPEINFDFNLIPTMGRDLCEIVTDARVVYSRQG